MNGADEYYDLISRAYKYGVGELETSNYVNYTHENITFVLGTHARGKTFSIYLSKWSEENSSLMDVLDVYGVVDGQPGWTESYGWLIEGSWIKYIEDYFDSLVKLISEKEKIIEEKRCKEKERIMKAQQEKIDKFDKLFT
jgi:hypothetical protein